MYGLTVLELFENETCVDGEVKAEAGHKWGMARPQSDVHYEALRPIPDFGAYPNTGAPDLGFPHFGW
jgi:hypothetical protein